MPNSEAKYLMVRAREEAVLATEAHHPSAAAVHQRLSVLYSAKAVIEFADGMAEPPPTNQVRRPK
jgi:hypothetical protein